MPIPRLGHVVDQRSEVHPMLVPSASDPLVDGIATGRATAESLRTLEFLVQPDDSVLDIGAFIGEYSVVLSPLVKALTAVEASPVNAALLRANLAINNAINCEVVEKAVVASHGPEWVALDGSSAYVTVSEETNERPGLTPTVTAAELVWRHRPSVMKVDIEGYEEHIRFVLADFVASGAPTALVVEINLLHYSQGAARVVSALRATGLPMWCLYPELPPKRCPPFETELPLRIISDLLVTSRALPIDFDVSPLSDEERACLYTGP